MRERYDKLIRDRIPEIMDGEGVRYEVARLGDEGYRQALRAKLVEEATEAMEADGAADLRKEIADVCEVIDHLRDAEGIDEDEVRALRTRRREERGGFARRLWLSWTER